MPDLSRLEALARTRQESRRELRAEALRAYHDGARKVDVAHAAGITRATLDAWIRSNGKEER